MKLFYTAQHFIALLIFLLACGGFGRIIVPHLLNAAQMESGLRTALFTLTGMGAIITALLFLAIAGQLRPGWIYMLLAAGCLCTAHSVWRAVKTRPKKLGFPSHRLQKLAPHWSSVAVAGVAICTALSPLRPPYMWDELAYHLPHAQQWAQAGSLTITPWLRYPWFPFNYDLLYAASLSVYDDVFTHLLNAASGWWIAFMLCRMGLYHGARLAGCLGAVLWLFYSRDGYVDAYVDFGTAAFVLGALFLLADRQPSRENDGVGILASFLLGVAVGIKYQALIFLPLLVFCLLKRKYRWRQILIAALAFAIPCAYWYLRNLFFTGDPFDPLGGKFFGFYDWNLQDYDYQLLDVHNGRGWPPNFLWPALLSPALIVLKSYPGAVKTYIVFSVYGTVIWLFTSHFPRYLIPSAPLLCFLSGLVISEVLNFVLPIKNWWRSHSPISYERLGTIISRHTWIGYTVVFSVIYHPISHNLSRDWKLISATPQEREVFLSRELSEYWGVLSYLNSHPGLRIYQNGMEGVLYYAPQPIYGDHFGPWRYRDFMIKPPERMAAKIREAGLNTLVVRVQPNEDPLNAPGFADYFRELYRDPVFRVYALKD